MALRDPRTKSALHLHPRNPDPTGSRSYGDPTDQAAEVFHQLAKEQLIPQIANRTRNAIAVDGRHVFLYQRLRSGRKCTCWDGLETDPHAECPICFSTGWAGGFFKFGTDLYLFDPSRQWFGVNTKLNQDFGTPPWFSLEDSATSGYVEWEESLALSRYMGLDSYHFEYRHQKGRAALFLKLSGSDPTFVPFSEEALRQRILLAEGGNIRFRVTLTRETTSDKTPLFQFFFFRTLINSASPPILIVDIPRRNESNVLVEYGALETFTPIQMAFSDEVKDVNLEDVVIRLKDMTRWKVIETSPNDPQNLITSHDVQLRKIFQHEALYKIFI